ncbi:hypothetical protein pb186bvf_001728 [Paramecium bursaria]
MNHFQIKEEQLQQKTSFIEKLEQLEENMNPILKRIKQIQNNIIIIGESGAGKNSSMNYELLQFKPIKEKFDTYFKVSEDCTKSETEVPQIEKISDIFQLSDIPGLQDQKEINDNKFRNLIEILDQLQENDFTLTFLLTFVEEYQTKGYLCNSIQELLVLKETKLTDKAKQLRKRTLDRQQSRILILSQPIDYESEIYQFNQEELKLIQSSIFKEELFQKWNLVFNFTDVNKQDIKTQQQQLEIQLNNVWNCLYEVSLKNQIIKNSFILPLEQQDQVSNDELEQNYKKKYLYRLQQINYLRQLLQQKELDNQYENHINELKNITTILEVDQQLSTIRIFCSFMIFIYSFIQFQVDHSLTQPGLSIYIKTKEFVVTCQNYAQINLKGNDGARIHPSKASQEMINPKNGENGKSGNNGQNGGNLYVDSQLYHYMGLLIIDVSGGNGSDGQNGGDGQDGENGKDADPRPVNEKNQAYRVDLLEKIVEDKDIENIEQQMLYKKQFHEQKQQIEKSQSNSLNKFTIVFLENKGTPGDKGGNSGAGGIGGLKGLKGQQLIDQDGSEGTKGIDGRPGKGGLKGKSYKRAYWDVKYYKGSMSKSQLFFFIAGSIFTLGTLFLVQLLSILHGHWLTNGDFIQEITRADDGKVNVVKKELREKEKENFAKYIHQFKQFFEIEQQRHNSSIFQHLMNGLT